MEASGDKNGGGKAKGGGGAIGLIIVSLLALGAGVGLPFMLMPDVPVAHVEKETKKDGHSKGHGASPSPEVVAVESVIVPLDPIVTNLAEPKTAWIRVEASVVMKKGVKIDKAAFSRKVGQDFIAFLRTVQLDQVATPSGYQNLYDDLNDRVKLRGEDNVLELIITGFVIE